MNTRINYKNLVRQLLPNHKRQAGRMYLLRGFVQPLLTLFADFEKWRSDMRIQINMTGQVGVIQGYLRAKYDSNAIRIANYAETGLAVGLSFEGIVHASRISLGLDPEDREQPAVVPLRGEIAQQFEDVDFIVYVPSTFDDYTVDLIRIDIEKYKQALVQFKIVRQ